MPTEFKLPELGENIAAGDVVRILVAPGDSVAKDQAVLELETDKATIEVPSSVSGTVKEIKIKQGDKVKVGQVVLTVDDSGASPAAPRRKTAKSGEAAAETSAGGDKPAPQPAGAPEEGGLSQEAPESKPAERKEPDSGKADAGARAEDAEEDASVQKPKRGEVVDINRGPRAPQPAPADSSPPAPQDTPAAPAAPSVRRLARELGVEIGRVPGSGPEGRVSSDDVQTYVRSAMSATTGGGRSASAAGAALPDFSRWGGVERKPMSNIRRKTAEHLSHAWNAIPHVTQHDKADITNLEALRKQYGPQAERAGGKLTMTAIALKIASAALRRFPQFNASLDEASNETVYRKNVHIGVAVDTERGLLVPVIRDVDRKGIFELAAELAKASEKARAAKLSLDEMQGGGFTITNLGGIGGT
ncbi:MAG: 2-oxo acid dehydrogenase subunit E2, partial [Acidobacteria bacterium]|nr:2-oxo acid dehydrogenase subunit E2 [Acidobacteriota bacterium]